MRSFRLLGALALAASVLTPLVAQGSSPVCSWDARTEPDTVNVAYPDTNATYWSHPYAATPGTSLVLHGTYAKARYFSFHVYQPSGVPLDSIYDTQIHPDAGSQNPFAGGSPRAAHQTYTVHVAFTAKPATPAPNTVYAGQLSGRSLPNPGGLLMMRVYTPTDPRSAQGGVPLPTVDTLGPGGQVLLQGSSCSSDAPSTGGAGTAALNSSSQPAGGGLAPGTITWGKAFGNNAAGFFGNQQNAYLTAGINRVYGDVVVLKLKAPRFPDTRKGIYPSSHDQLRYWSICQNSNSTRVNACTADYTTAVDKDGLATIVISDPAQRPANAIASKGVTWLAWGAADTTGTIIYRHMVPATSFPQAIQSIRKGQDPATVMGAYYPQGRYCSKAAFERGGWKGCLES